MRHSSMASGMCLQLRLVIDTTIPPNLCLGHVRTPLPSHCRLRLIGCESHRAGFQICRLLRARCLLDLIAMIAVLRRAMCMKCIGVYLLFAFAVQSLCCADVTKLAPEDRRVLE